jgi:hypothetical protein
LLEHGLIGTSQYVPLNPNGQIQINWLPNERHSPLFRQGNDAHGFTGIPQFVPVNPLGHKHW